MYKCIFISYLQLRINVTDINNHIPSFPLSSYIRENVSEDILVGTEILTGMLESETSPSALIDHVGDATEDNGGFNKYLLLLRQQLITEKSITFNDCHKSYTWTPSNHRDQT
jgi:hypothetical protein